MWSSSNSPACSVTFDSTRTSAISPCPSSSTCDPGSIRRSSRGLFGCAGKPCVQLQTCRRKSAESPAASSAFPALRLDRSLLRLPFAAAAASLLCSCSACPSRVSASLNATHVSPISAMRPVTLSSASLSSAVAATRFSSRPGLALLSRPATFLRSPSVAIRSSRSVSNSGWASRASIADRNSSSARSTAGRQRASRTAQRERKAPELSHSLIATRSAHCMNAASLLPAPPALSAVAADQRRALRPPSVWLRYSSRVGVNRGAAASGGTGVRRPTAEPSSLSSNRAESRTATATTAARALSEPPCSASIAASLGKVSSVSMGATPPLAASSSRRNTSCAMLASPR